MMPLVRTIHRQMQRSLKPASTVFACLALAASGMAMDASTGGFSTADGNVSTARKFTASTFEGIQAIIDAARYTDGGSNCGWWDMRGNNIASTADFATYNITWTTPASGDKSASAWTTTSTFPKILSYTYEAVTPQCVKDKLSSYAGVGKNGGQLTASACSVPSSMP